jgi:signal transduction histidine kinase
MTDDTAFARLVSLACHDARTPLATAYGFARTLERTLADPELRYVSMIASAASELGEILDLLSLASRIEDGRWAPELVAVESEALAQAAAARGKKGDGEVAVVGTGVAVRVATPAAELALAGFARCALRHGGLERVELQVVGAQVAVSPVAAGVGPILLGEDLRDLGAAVGGSIVRALGGSVAVEGDRFVVQLQPA